ncbi:hypothetical protein GCM10010435_53350 [Winogradskya consettensis]|uniref:Fimbrial assembly protein PilN n=1 Tax=Winogradskya consettensis TaxID=113560 RepID=A0A919SGZ8_9ACTN|nr:hypothetical protein [Actinoplanes consettensis]GIM71601.1 hypothetical protein Aco04nite_26090 [Actinoplanes consettensis]
MATTLMPVDPAMSPQRATRVLHISASLLPEEIISARRARRTRGWAIVAVIIVACLLGGWFFVANQETRAADDELSTATTEVTDLQRSQRAYKEVVDVQNSTDTLSKQLKAVMKDDLDWAALYTTLSETAAASGLSLDSVNGALNAAGSGTTTDALPSTSTSAVVGTLTVTGSGPDKEAVAAYIDALTKQSVLANPYVTAVNTDKDGTVTFNASVDFVAAALCGRFGTKCGSK